MVPLSLTDVESGRSLASSAFQAETFMERARGWLGKDRAEQGECLWLPRCSSVHTMGMKFDLDLVFLDQNFRVVKVSKEVKPFRVAFAWGAESVLELPSGCADRYQLRPGSRMMISARHLGSA